MATEEDLPVVLPPTYTRQKVYRWPSGETVDDAIADEVPISITYNGISHVVMMASPELLEEFAVGFSLSERIIPDISHIYDIQVKEGCGNGLVVEMEISPRCFFKLKEHRRSMVGRTGCGICGVESLKDVELKPEPLEHTYQFDMNFYQPAMMYFEQVQKVGQVTGSTHAMLAFTPDGEFLGGTEDVGRHVALDKLIGMRAMKKWGPTVVFLSSRASYEMVQKAAVTGIEILFAISAPTNRALRLAKKCDLTLCAFCRDNRANIYNAPERLLNL